MDGSTYNVCSTKKTSKDIILHNKLIPPQT
jgi:hypothetical protein